VNSFEFEYDKIVMVVETYEVGSANPDSKAALLLNGRVGEAQAQLFEVGLHSFLETSFQDKEATIGGSVAETLINTKRQFNDVEILLRSLCDPQPMVLIGKIFFDQFIR
jgi:hypothetical protein